MNLCQTRVTAEMSGALSTRRNMTLKRWASLALNRQGRRFASCHPIFCFLHVVFNTILPFNNNRISMIMMSPSNYNRTQDIFLKLSLERLHQATKASSTAEAERILYDIQTLSEFQRKVRIEAVMDPVSSAKSVPWEFWMYGCFDKTFEWTLI